MNNIDFLEEYKKFKELQKRQQNRGLNDFNLLTTVLKYSDEVRVHSKVIVALLNPKESHYQEELFLEIFLHTLLQNQKNHFQIQFLSCLILPLHHLNYEYQQRLLYHLKKTLSIPHHLL